MSLTLNLDAILTAYDGLAESILRYSIIFWGHLTNTEITKGKNIALKLYLDFTQWIVVNHISLNMKL